MEDIKQEMIGDCKVTYRKSKAHSLEMFKKSILEISEANKKKSVPAS